MPTRKALGVAAPLAVILALATGAHGQEQEQEAKPEAETKAEMTVTLEERNDSGITGTAVIAPAAEAEKPHAHRVTVNLSGAEAGTYPAHVHRGTCETGGGVATALGSITVEAADQVASSTTVVNPEQLAAGVEVKGEVRAEAEETEEMAEAAMREEAGEKMEHGPLFIQVHLPDGTPAACGDIAHEGHEGHEGKDGGGGH